MIYLITNQRQLFSNITSDIEFGTMDQLFKYFKSHKEIEVDTETSGLDCHSDKLISIQFGDKYNQFVVDLLTVDIKLFKNLLENNLLLFQNAKFDLKFLYKQNIWPDKIYDTFLAESVLSMGDKLVRKGLGILVERYTGTVLDKEMQSIIHKEGLSVRGIIYAANDVKYLGMIKEKQLVRIKELELDMALSLDNQFVRVLAFVEYCGFYLDGTKWKAKMDEDKLELQKSLDVLNNWIITNKMTRYIDNQLDMFSNETKVKINWDSAKQVIPLMQELGIDTKVQDKKTGKNKDSVDIKLLAAQLSVHEIVPKYVEYKKIGKIVSAFGESILEQIHKNTGRIHTTYKQLMDTGRMSCGGKDRSTGKSMVNLQQIPADKRHRGCFTSEEGNTLVVADYSGQESVVFANFCQDPELLAFYNSGEADMHSFIAKKIYPELEHLTLDEIKTQHKDKRQIAKAAGFAIQYGGVGKTIADNLGISLAEGDKIYEGYFEAFSGVKEYFERCKEQVLKDGYVTLNNVSKRKSFVDFFDDYLENKKIVTASGFWDKYKDHKKRDTVEFKTYYKQKVRDYFKWQGAMERKSYNFPIQGSSAEITKLAALNFFNYIKSIGMHKTIKICNIVHDEIIIECSEQQSSFMADSLQKFMENAGKPFCPIIPLKAVPMVTKSWQH